MKASRLGVPVALFLLSAGAACAQRLDSRHTSAPVTLRGVASHVRSDGFSLVTRTRGTFSVSLRAATAVDIEGRSGKARVHDGDHVGVRGMVQGRQMVAIRVRIYPVSSRVQSRTISGKVSAVHGSVIVIAVANRSLTVRRTASTAITGSPSAGGVRVGDKVRVRMEPARGGYLALSIHVDARRVAGQSVRLHGMVVAKSTRTISVRSGSSTQTITTTRQTRFSNADGSGPSGLVHSGETVTVHACCAGHRLTATSVHVDRSPSNGRRLRIRASVVAVWPGGFRLGGSKSYSVQVGASTRVSVGSTSGSIRNIRVGEVVTAYVCCEGSKLVASSVHIHSSPSRATVVTERGTVLYVDRRVLKLRTAAGVVSVGLMPSTEYSKAGVRVSATAVQPGERIAARTARQGSLLQALAVRIDVSQPRSSLSSGTLVAIRGQVIVLARGRGRSSVTTTTTTRITLNGTPSSLAQLHPGDIIHVRGFLDSKSRLVASSVRGSRPRVRTVTVRGTVLDSKDHNLRLRTLSGQTLSVQLASGAGVMMNGVPAPADAVFPGAPLEVRGHISAGTFIATSARLQLRARAISARLRQVTSHTLVLELGAARILDAQLIAGARIFDGGSRADPTRLREGAYVDVHGYEGNTGYLWASEIHILHPQVRLVGVFSSVKPHALFVDASSRKFRLHIDAQTSISVDRAGVSLSRRDLAPGMRAVISGQARTDGSVSVSAITLRLSKVTARAKVAAINTSSFMAQTTDGSWNVHVAATTTFTQGIHGLSMADLVVGDDVSVEGYALSTSSVLARRVDVHRKLIGVDGTIASVTPAGFSLTAVGGGISVVTATTTILTGTSTALSVGQRVHVTGYQRGDGSILATRVRILAGKRFEWDNVRSASRLHDGSRRMPATDLPGQFVRLVGAP